MDMFVIQGGNQLRGKVRVDGAKNAALPIMAAALAIDGNVELSRVPDLVDVTTMSQLLQSLGVTVTPTDPGALLINASECSSVTADYELVRRMRASICVLGPLLARFGRARVSLPGGCNIGHRPIDLHLKGLAALGADLRVERGYVIAAATQLRGAEVFLGGPAGSTVTGTCNVMVAASLAKGRTVIRGAACEPEVVDLADFLNAAGANITGHGTPDIAIEGVEHLDSVQHTVIGDRIEAATLAIAAAATRGDILILDAPCQSLTAIVDILRATGVSVETTATEIRVCCPSPLEPAAVTALPYPGIPTDTQAQLMALATTITGSTVVRDAVFPDRFMHASELLRMGAKIRREGAAAVVEGGHPLTGASVMASDLRASAALVIAGLAADGETQVRRIYHLDRGYVRMEQKLTSLGATVSRQPDQSLPGALPPPHFTHATQDDKSLHFECDERR